MPVRKIIDHAKSFGQNAVNHIAGLYASTAGYRFSFAGILTVIGGLAALGMVIVFFGGFAIGKYKAAGFETTKKWEESIFRSAFYKLLVDQSTAGLPGGTDLISTTFVDFKFSSVAIANWDQTNGGGLTEIGEDVLLVTQNGTILHFSKDKTVSKSQIIAPDNGFGAYKAAAEGRLAHLQHKTAYFRYNDIEFLPIGEAGTLALSYTEWDDANTCFRSTISLLRLRDDFSGIAGYVANPADWERLYQTEPCLKPKTMMNAIEGLAAGGRLAFKAPSTLAFGSGDYHMDGVYSDEALAQRVDNAYGKIIEIDLLTRDARIVSSGHRNMQGVSFDADGNLWAVEHGMRGGDEINFVREGADYGWPAQTLGTRYSGLPWPGAHSDGYHDVFEPPAFAWLPSIATSSLRLIENVDPSWNGDLLLASLNAQNLYRLRLDGDRVRFVETIEIGQRIRYALPRHNGEILLWTDSRNLITLTPQKGNATQDFIDEFVSTNIEKSLQSTVRDGVTACLQCHAFFGVAGRNAPPLGVVAGGEIGGTGWDGYSEGMTNASGIWDRETLSAYLIDPQAVVPGTVMPASGLNEKETRDALVELLFALSENQE